MAKKVTGVVKLQIPAGAANPAPPVGPALGSAGVNIMQFCKEFNAKTAKDSGLVIPVIITVYQDRSFSLQFKSPPASVLLKKEAGLAKGSGVPNKNKVGKVTRAQLEKIVEMKKADLNTTAAIGKGFAIGSGALAALALIFRAAPPEDPSRWGLPSPFS